MSEAYEIGVTHALSDGVSESMSAAKKDIAQLERILHSGGVSIQQLRLAAAGVVSAIRQPAQLEIPQALVGDNKDVRGESGRLDATGVPSNPADNANKRSAPEQSNVNGAQKSRAEGASFGLADLGQPPIRYSEAPKVLDQKPSFPGRPDVDGIADITPGASQAARDGLQPTSVAVPAFSIPRPLPRQVFERDFINTVGTQSKLDHKAEAVRAPRSSVGQEGAVKSSASAFTQDVPNSPNTPSRRGTSQATAPAFASALAGWSTPLPQQDGLSPQPAYEAPSSRGNATGDESGRKPDRDVTPAAPVMPPSSGGRTEGDVFLDGALVGRWLSKHLAQQAGRASAGPTGFDPRRGRLLPGATVGS